MRCSTPLPEDSADPVLTRMLVPVPYQVPAQEDKKKSKEAGSDLDSAGMPDTMSGETEAPSPKDDGEGEGGIPSPHGRKRTASEDLEVGAPKRGKVSLPYGSGSEADVIARHLSGDKPLAGS